MCECSGKLSENGATFLTVDLVIDNVVRIIVIVVLTQQLPFSNLVIWLGDLRCL